MSKTVVEEFYKRQANGLTNLLFDKGFLSTDLTRETIDWLEEYLGYLFQSHSEAAVRAAMLVKEVRRPLLVIRPKQADPEKSSKGGDGDATK